MDEAIHTEQKRTEDTVIQKEPQKSTKEVDPCEKRETSGAKSGEMLDYPEIKSKWMIL